MDTKTINIEPTLEGYRQIAKAFRRQIIEDASSDRRIAVTEMLDTLIDLRIYLAGKDA